MPATDNRFVERCEYVNLDLHQQRGKMHLVMTREDRGQPMTRPLDGQSKGSIIIPRRSGYFDTGNQGPYILIKGTMFGGLFKEWCNHRSIKPKIGQGIEPLWSRKKVMRPRGQTLAYGWPRGLLKQRFKDLQRLY